MLNTDSDDAEHGAVTERRWGFHERTPWMAASRLSMRQLRELLATVPQGAREAIATIVRSIFAQSDHASAMTQRRKVADGLRTRFPRAATVLEETADDILAYRHLPVEHQRQLHSANPLERLNKEIKRGSNVVGLFPNPAAVIRLWARPCLSRATNGPWPRRYFSAESMKQPTTPLLSMTTQKILAAIG